MHFNFLSSLNLHVLNCLILILSPVQAEELHKRVVGQDEAVSAVADAVLRGRAGVCLGVEERELKEG